jgi:hypothetical protein
MNLRKVITEALIAKKVISNCDCGCKASEKCNKAPILNENVAPREILSEGLQYHINNNKPLTENVYRAGSSNYFDLWAEARAMYVRGIIDAKGDDLEILTETHIGEFDIFEGKKVPLDFPIKLTEEEIDEAYSTYEQRMINQIKRFKKEGLPMFNLPMKTQKFYAKHKKEIDALNEAKKKDKKKNPPLNKPKRGGSKAYYVYVKDPKTKRIKKVSFGSGGLKAKINNPKARQAFAKRHRCSEKTDKTKASYWSCRLPRYAKLLGLKSNFSGFW